MAKILVIDDDPDFTKMLQFQLEEQGFDVEVVHTREAALSQVALTVFDLILLDVYLSNQENGLEVLTTLKETTHTNNVPIILITGLTSELFLQEPNVDKYLGIAKELISKADGPKHIVERVHQILTEKESV